ncbi:nucleotidyltransferase domain-containing protein [Paraburkholderia sp. UCT2]|uniref:nucleotidyltransferase domain-containing protein n=1 Tax=Paraburkholderia sp. UCT2 TaxID=2615208 RepID=UPI0016550FB0|nr:nucleotidyltransferase domain-containing protein [Paraburkholderia sp. UCT2]
MSFEEFLERSRNKPSTTLQIALLIRIADALRESPECAGAVVVGSFAKDSADRLSDIDLVVFCLEGAGHSVADPLPTSGPTLCQWPFPRGQAAVKLFVRPSAVGTCYSCRLPQ